MAGAVAPPIMFKGFVALTAIEVSLCGPIVFWLQSVLTLAALDVAVVQNGTPGLALGAVPNWAEVSGAGALMTLCVTSTACGFVSATAAVWPAITANPASENRSKGLSLTTTSFEETAGSHHPEPLTEPFLT